MLTRFAIHNDNQDVILQLRIRAVQVLLVFLLIAGFLTAITILLESGLSSPWGIITGLTAVISAISLVIIHRGRGVQTIGTIVVFLLAIISIAAYSGNLGTVTVLFMLTTIGAAIIIPRSLFWLLNAVIIGSIAWFIAQGGVFGAAVPVAERTVTTLMSSIVLGAIPPVVGLMLRYFVDRLEQVARNSQRTAILLEASANIGQSVSQMLELNDLLNRAVEIIRDRFAFYHVQVFLIDDSRDYAYLQASTGEIGEQLLARGHRLRLDSNSVIGRVSLAGEPIIARDSDSGHAFNELLPDTRSELAIPIKDSDGIIGALDVQSRLSNAFTANEIRVLNVIANQLATAIRNARLFENQAHSLRENKRLFIESETNLREIQRLNRQLTRQAWTDYLKMDRRITGVTLEGQGFSNKAEWSPEMVESGQRRRPIKANTEGQRKVAVPIELRGEVVGAIEIELPKFDDEESTIDMIQAISQRLAVSLDNARLFEETQEATAQEQRVGELVSRYQSANTVDDLLQITLEGLIETLGADAGSIRLGRLPELDIAPDAEPNGHSHNGGAQA
jgi:GAF domain-containing protein